MRNPDAVFLMTAPNKIYASSRYEKDPAFLYIYIEREREGGSCITGKIA